MSEILTIHGGLVQGQDSVDDGEFNVYVLDTDDSDGVVGLDCEVFPKTHTGKTLDEVAREIVHSYSLSYAEDCEHEEADDHIICHSCHKCTEDVDDNDICIACGGVDHSKTLEDK
tara:strand:+ start:760 stop:1104 length:345 start_codon:yes stop_codon:yes gene_type:complete